MKDNKNNINIIGNNMNDSEKDKNKEGSQIECSLDKENSEDINEDIELNWFKKNLKERVALKKKENKKKNKSIKKYKYPKDD